MTKRKWIFYGKLYRTIDGDTIQAEIDQGFDDFKRPVFRLFGLDTPEMKGETKWMGEMARTHLENMLVEEELIFESIKIDKYGPRYDAIVTIDKLLGPKINPTSKMIEDGYGLPFNGKGPRPIWDPNKPYPIRGGVSQ